ncbi:MAG: ABC transporter permease [Candidatus Cloacimonetes bacterium]|nr:ABC transporter permease [Candidatus Cloacimonadota bacterium]MDY0299155.1 ABC transporter permease [Candidatus Cloacimonadaceae bacterium]MCK9332631.1 ABC transporter permease [Candidatus Cloacimonadota bacterium]MDD2210911.1 ABC transporter permease [Candidatus Cloacimonadota bacterium]MDD4232034.1 ABC transporter permease [Candidatus Cloacimonadota bacterium]
MKSDTLKIAKWELMRYLTNKQYLISLVITPVIIVALMAIPTLLAILDKPRETTFYIVDELGILEQLRAGIAEPHIILKEAEDIDDLPEQIYNEKASGYILIDRDFWHSGEISYYYNKLNHEELGLIRSVLNGMLGAHRMQELGLDEEELAFLKEEVKVTRNALEKAETLDKNVIVVSVVFMALVFIMIFSAGTMLMQSALQERRDRMAEIVLSSIKPASLMQGKIIGHFLLAFIQIVFWLFVSIPGVIYFLNFPVFDALQASRLGMVFFFGLGGYMLYSSIYVSIGATMDDMQSAGNTQSLAMMLPMFSILFVAPIIENPDGLVSRFASLFPLTSPMAVVIRSVFVKIPLWEILLSAVLLLASIYLISRLAAKIFRVGMLMYGKTANFGEMMRWLRYKD